MQVNGQLHVQAAVPQANNPGTYLTGGYVGPRAGLDGSREEKMSCVYCYSKPSPSSH